MPPGAAKLHSVKVNVAYAQNLIPCCIGCFEVNATRATLFPRCARCENFITTFGGDVKFCAFGILEAPYFFFNILLSYSFVPLVYIEIRCKDPEKEGVLSTQVSTHSVGGVAHYSCPRGFYMEGNETRVCLQNGSWSGSTPACFCKYIRLIFD